MSTASAAQTKPTAVVEIERLGFGFTEVADYDLTRLDYTRRVQVRETKHYNPRELVERYAAQMSETAFPPIVVTADDWIVDGNTRVDARVRLRKEKFAPAYVLDVEWDGARTTEKQKRLLVALAATLNANAGLPLSAREAREVTAELIKLEWKAEQIARAIGAKPATVTQVRKEIAAVEKLTRVGLNLNGSGGVRGASLRALGAKDVLALNDVPFRELATLAADAGFNASEITTAAKQARELGADDKAMEMLRHLRVENNDRIQEQKLTGAAKPPVSRQLRQHLGFVTKYQGREQELLETDPKVSEAHIASLTTSIQVLSAVLEMQQGGQR
jgi:hypothetical protein